VDGYYNSLLTFIDKAVEEGFINPSARRIIVLAPTAQELMDKLEVRGWIDDQNLLLPNSVSSSVANGSHASCTNAIDVQEYEPYHDRVASTLNWEMDHQLGC
jgi:hypothetical protein